MPNRFEDGIFGMVPQEEWLNVGWQPVTRPNDPIDSLFSDTKTENITAKWETIANEYQIPVMAQFHAFDTESLTTFRIPVENKYIEKGLIKVKINQSERMRTLIRSGIRNDDMYDYVVNDGIRLADQVITRTKVAKNELMATGKVTIRENNLNLEVDYGVPSANTSFTLDFSDSAQTDIIDQIQTIVDAATAKGVTINGMITSKKNINKMRRNASLQKAINGNIGAGTTIRRTALEAFLDEEFGINRIITSDQTYGASGTIGSDGLPSITTKRYFPDDKITFFASNGGNIGTGLWGDPPEVGDFEHRVNASGQSPYVYISQKMEWDPHVLWTKASGLFIPVLYNPYSLYIATVAEEYDIRITDPTATVTVNGTKKLGYTVSPKDATVTWTSSDSTVATVSAGTVTGVGAGSAIITASITDEDNNTYTDVCAVTVAAGA